MNLVDHDNLCFTHGKKKVPSLYAYIYYHYSELKHLVFNFQVSSGHHIKSRLSSFLPQKIKSVTSLSWFHRLPFLSTERGYRAAVVCSAKLPSAFSRLFRDESKFDHNLKKACNMKLKCIKINLIIDC